MTTSKSHKSKRCMPPAKDLHFDIDKYLNRIVAPSQLSRFPSPISKFLGYRKEPRPEVGNILIAFWACVGSIAGLLVIGALFRYAAGIKELNPPVLFASFGATAILTYNTIHSPLAAPRNAIVGHTISVVIGLCISKLFQLNPDFTNLRWVGGPLACGIASAAMTLTNTVHPPGGATALLAVIDPTVIAMGWWFVPLIILGTVLMLCVGLLLNNIQRQYPAYWWTPKDVRRTKPADVETLANAKHPDQKSEIENAANMQDSSPKDFVVIGPQGYILPEGVTLTIEETKLMFSLQQRLRAKVEEEGRSVHDKSGSDSASDKSHSSFESGRSQPAQYADVLPR